MYDKSSQYPQPAPPKEQIQNCQLKTTTILSHAVAIWDFLKEKRKKNPHPNKRLVNWQLLTKLLFNLFFLFPFFFHVRLFQRTKSNEHRDFG